MLGSSVAIPAILNSLAAICVLVCFRAAPFVGFMTVARRIRLGPKLVTTASFLALALLTSRAAPESRDALLALPVVYAYLGVLAVLLPSMARAVRAGWIARFPLALGLLTLYVAVPAAFAPPGALLPALLLGWDSSFKAFSYCVDAADERGSVYANALFFMLVSPTLVWAERGLHVGGTAARTAAPRRGVLRCLLGLLTWVAEDVIRSLSGVSAIQALAGQATVVLSGVAYYMGHSGLASLQIGFMSMLGYSVRERYVYPLLARDPVEFWRRWNTWLGSWARRYLFVPLSTRLRRTFRTFPGFISQGAAVLLTFASVGVFHDAIREARYWRQAGAAAASLDATLMFIGFGLLVAVWVAVASWLRRASTRLHVPERIVHAMSWTVFMPLLAVMYRVAESVLSNRP